jgi:hypothetical protein
MATKIGIRDPLRSLPPLLTRLHGKTPSGTPDRGGTVTRVDLVFIVAKIVVFYIAADNAGPIFGLFPMVVESVMCSLGQEAIPAEFDRKHAATRALAVAPLMRDSAIPPAQTALASLPPSKPKEVKSKQTM